MVTVVVALIPAILMAMYNTGLQTHQAVQAGAAALDNWQTTVMKWLGFEAWVIPASGADPWAILPSFVHGALYYLPILIVTFAVGGTIEVIFAMVRKHEVNEGFLVTGMLFPLTLPATQPLWQVAIGIAFGVFVGKEIFGGTGMNILNPALTARVFLFFAYPAEISGDRVWIAAQTSPDGYSGATWLAEVYQGGMATVQEGALTWWQAFLGFMPGSLGETSALACLIGAVIILITGVGSWRIMLSATIGTVAISLLLNAVGSETNGMLEVPFYWHFVLGSWAFAVVFMATDPVSAAQTNAGRWIYGFLIGVICILIRTVNPAYPEGMMLGILFMNLFSPLIDHYVIRANVRRRQLRYAT
jgi:Na+-transporting NADH:ubiquinone oxidoreductase subunit B